VRDKNVYESLRTLTAALRTEEKVETSATSLRRWLSEQGYEYGKKRFMGTMPVSFKHQRMRAFVSAYVRAKREEDARTAALVFTDESYIHSQHSTKNSWHHSSDSDVRAAEKGGQRLIIIHAMTKHGLLEVAGSSDENYNDLTHEAETAAFVFQSVGVNDDYHTAVTGSSWVAWLNNRLIPTFKAMFPGKKMILVLDNAKYHHARGADWYSPSTMSKTECVSFLEHFKVDSITVQRDGQSVTFTADTYAGRGKLSPTLPELKHVIADYLKSHPDINQTLPQKAMKKLGWELLYTPPYVPEVQPIELVWATVKQLVARQSVANRSVADTQRQTEEAFDQLSAESCQKRITHCEKYISSWLKTPAADELQQYKDFADLLARLPDSEVQKAAESAAALESVELDVEQ
jgi:transposase